MEVELEYTKNQLEVFWTHPDVKYLIIRKGRRFGLTMGAALMFIESLLEGVTPLLWVDTINGNIDRYYDRYFYPVLKANKIEHNFNRQKRQLTIGNSYADFRSADRPESIEGFGYKKIFLNEAGIILKNNYLYTNAILPMLMDYSDSQLIAGGAPKGKFKKDGTEHLFYTLSKKRGDQYKQYTFSSYDNPLLNKEDIEALEQEIGAMSQEDVLQEIYGEFIDKSGSNPFAHKYEKDKHEGITKYDPQKTVYVGMDFNLNPFGFVFAHIWEDQLGKHFHIFDECTIENANLEMGIEMMKKYPTHNMKVTGDAMGRNRDFGQKDNASYYTRIERELKLRPTQLSLPPNPKHTNSRDDVNYCIAYLDFKIDPSCKNTCRDFQTVQCDAFGSIQKRNRNDLAQRADHIDGVRYLVNAFLFDWIRKHQKRRK